jgi:hypothetical protein
MSLRNKLAEAMTKGTLLERDRCMRICTAIAQHLRQDLSRKLMSASEKHLAEVKFNIVSAVLGAVQIKITSGEDPNGNDPVQPGPGASDSDDHPMEAG